jgi:hypothetical protein
MHFPMRIITIRFFIFLFFILVYTINGLAQVPVTGDFRSAATGNWATAGTWQRYSSGGAWQNANTGENNPGQVPGLGGTGGNVTIQNTHIVTLNTTNTTAIASLTIGGGASGTLQFETTNNRTLTITGGLTIAAGGALNTQNLGVQAGSIIIGGTLSNAGTISLRQTAARYADITLNGTSLTGNGTYTSLHDLIIGGTVTNNSLSTINLYGDLTCNNTLNCTAGMISFVSGAGQNLNGTTNPILNNLDVRNTSTSVSIGGSLTSVTVSGTVALNTGTANALNLGNTLTSFTVGSTFTMTTASTSFNFGITVAKTVTIGGNFVTPQVITMSGASLAHQLKLGGASNGTPATFTTTAGSGSIVEYYGSSQNIFASINYRNVKLSGSGTKIFSSTTTINNDLDITAGGLLVSNINPLTISGNLDVMGGGVTTWGGGAINTTGVTSNLTVTNNSTFKFGDQAFAKTINVTGNVQVDAGSTMNVGAFAAAHVLSISGNLQVDGTFNMVETYPANVCNVTFAGSSNTTVTSPAGTGSIDFNQITMGKGGLANVTDVQTLINISAPTSAGNNLILTTGTFKLSSASTLTPYYGAATICNTTGGLWLNHPSANVSCVGTGTTTNPGIPTVSGLLHLTAGNFSYGSGNDVMVINNTASNIWIDGGTLTVYGGVAFSNASQFTMTSGNFKIDPQGADNLATATTVVSFGSTAVGGVGFTGGALTIINPPFSGAGGTSLFVSATAGLAYDFSGSTINLGDGVSNKNGIATVGFTIDGGGRYALGDLRLNNGTSTGTNRIARLLNTDCIVGGDLNIGSNTNDNFQINGRTLTLNGTITVGTGTLVGGATSNLTIGGNNTAVMNLPPINGGNLLNLTINKTGTNNVVNLGNTVTLATTGVLTLTSGILELGNYNLQLLNSAVAGIVGVSGAQTYSVANMIATDGSGYLIGNAVAPALRVNNPIGAMVAGTYYYSPMILSAITTGGTYSVRVVPTALSPTYLSIYWDLVTSISGKTITATFQYDPAEFNGSGPTIVFQPSPYSAIQAPPSSGVSSFGTNSFTITNNVNAATTGYWSLKPATNYYSYQTGDWNTASTWTIDPSGTLQIGSTVPGYNDNVVILTGRTVSLSANITTQNMNLTINSSGFLDMATYSFSSSLATFAGEGTVRLASVNFPTVTSNTFVNAGGGTVEYYNAASFTLPAAQTTYNNLTINCSGQIATQTVNLTLNGNLLISNGTFQINDNTTATRRQLTINGNVTVNSGAAIAVGKGVTNSTTNPLTPTTTIAGPFIDYYDSQSHRVVIYGDFINNGTVNFSNITYPVYNLFPPTTLGTTTGFATVYFRGSTSNLLTCNNTTNFYNLVLDKGVDQTYSLTVNSSAYANFKLFGANIAAADISMGASATNPNIKKALWIRNGTLTLQGSTIIPSLTEGNTSAALPATSDYYIPANGALDIDGPDVVVLVTSDDYREVNIAYGVSGGTGSVNGVIKSGYSALYVYGKYQMDNGYLSTRESGGIITNGGSGQININGGIVDAKQFLNATSSTAAFQMSNGFFLLRGRFQRIPTAYTTVANLTDTASATIGTSRALNGTTTAFGTFNINNTTNIYSVSGGNIYIYDVCDASPPATAQYAFEVKTSSSNYNVTGGTVTFMPTSGSALVDETNFLISSTAPFGNLHINRISGSTGIQLNTSYPLTVLGNFTITAGNFNANGQNLTVGGNFNIANSATTYTSGSNTTILNGSGTQTFTVNTSAALGLYNLALTKTAGVAVTFAGTQKTINVSGTFNLTLGTLNDNGNSIFVTGNVYNSGVHSGAGKISLNGTATQTIDGAGTFQNLELNNTNAATAPVSLISNTTISGALTLSQNKLFNISTYNLKLNAAASIINASTLRYIQCAGNAGDGGITKEYNSTATFTFPVGAASTSHATPNYTPAAIGLGTAPNDYGSITVVPVGYAHPNATTAGRSLTYFWRVSSSGFTGFPTYTHTYTYSVNDVVTGTGITEAGYVAARFHLATATWTRGTTLDMDISSNKYIGPTTGTFLKNVSFIDGDYTAGDDNPVNPFGTPKVFYSYASGVWGSAANWTSDPTRASYVNIGIPAASDIVYIGNNHTISLGIPAGYLTTADTDPRSCATLYIESGAVLDNRYNPSSNYGIVMSSPGGNGKIRITLAQSSPSTFANPRGDFSSFNAGLGTTELYTTNSGGGTLYYMANGVTTYGNLLFSPLGGSNILFPNNDVLIYGNCTETGGNAESWLAPCWTNTYPLAPTTLVAKTITINGNLDIQGGAFVWYQNGSIAQNLIVKGDVKVCTTCALDGTQGGATNQTLTIGGSLINNTNGIANSGSTTIARVNLSNVPVTFNGSTSATISNTTGTPTTIFSTVTVNKGSSQATTLNCTIGGTLTTPTDNWLTLQNGTFQYQRTSPSTDLTISTTTNLSIPSTAGLYVNYTGSTNVLIANSGVDASDLLLIGKLTVTGGNVYVGPTTTSASNNDIEYYGTAAAIEVNGGNLYVNGQIRRPTSATNGSLNYTQTAGAVTINGNSSVAGLTVSQTRAKLAVLNPGSQFNMSGGTLTIQRGGGTTFGDLYLRPSSSTVTGGTIIFTNTIPNSIQSYSLDSNTPLFNLTVTQGGAGGTTATVNLVNNALVLNGSLTFSTNKSFLNCNNYNVTINKDLINNGGAGCYMYGTNLTTFSGATQNISGSAVTNFYDLTISPSISLTVNNSFSVNRNLNITSGNLLLSSYKISVLNAGSFTNNGAYTDNGTTGCVSMAGSALQQISGTGSYQRLEINNSSGVSLENDITLLHDLVMTSGILDIKSNNLILNTSSSISGSPFSSSKMIKTDGVASSAGLKKFFPVIASTTPFTFPVGVSGKYTPAVFSITANGSIGYINVNPINAYQPTVLDPTKVLDYYWNIASSGITGFNGSVALGYSQGDVSGTEASYVAAYLLLPGTYWTKATVGAATDNVNETTHKVSFIFPAGTSNLNGDYTAGEDPAILTQIPTYISNKNGSWSDNTVWTPVGSSPPCPVGGPNGYNVIIKDSVGTITNHCNAYSTIIRGTGKLAVLSPTYGHNFGTVDGDTTLGTGTLYLQTGNMPAGSYTLFLDCSGDGTMEYGGSGTYTLILNSITTLPNLTVSGTGTRVLPNSDLIICNRLKINGPTLNNSISNRKLTIDGSMERYGTGAFLSGTGSNATVTFAGTAAQTLGGPIGNFTGTNGFNNLEINNSYGLSIGASGNIEVNGNLLLTSGVISTSASSSLSILNTSASAVVPIGGSSSSYISGPLKKQIANGGSFIYPLGKGAVAGHTFTLTSTSSGTNTFIAEYFTPNPTYTSYTTPLLVVNSREYWAVTATGSKTAKVKMAWDSQSDLNGTMTQNGITDLQAAEYNSGTSSWTALTSTTSGSNSSGDVSSTNNVSLSVATKNYSIGSISNTRPTATLSPTGPVCGTAGIPVTFTSSVPITLNYTLSYKLNGVAQTPVVVSALPYTLPTPTAGTYQLTGFTYNNSSVAGAVDGTIITDYTSPTVSVAGSNQSPCNATSLNLPGNTPVIGTGLWTVVSGTSSWFNIPDATNSNALFGGPPGYSYVLRWTITNGTCTSSSTVNISFPFSPAQPSAFTAAPTNICQGSTGNIYTVPAVSGATSYSWSYSGTGATITGNSNSVSVNFSLSATSGTMSASAINGCGTGTARTTAVVIDPMPVATFSYTGTPYCQNAANPTPAYSGSGSAGTFSSTTGLVFVSTSTGQVNLSASTPGTYTVTNTKAAAGSCSGAIATSSITITALGNWVGGTSTDWFNPSNWICTTIPTSTVDVIIPNSATFKPAINSAGAVCRSISIGTSSTLTINGSNTFNVYGDWTNNGSVTSNSSTVIFNGTGTIGGSTTTAFNNITIAGTANVTAPAGNMTISGNFTNNGTFSPSTGKIIFNGNATQTISGSNATAFNKLTINNNDATGVNLSKAITVSDSLILTKGLLNTTSTNILTLTTLAKSTTGNATSYINGPLAYNMANNGTSTLRLPIGKGADWRPVILIPSHNTATSYTYTAELFNASARALGWTLPGTIDAVSKQHYIDINRTITATAAASSSTDLTGATVQLYYGTNDMVTDYTNVTLAKAPAAGGSWTNIGGTASGNGSGSITSNSFNSFSRFALANKVAGTNPLPIELISFEAIPNKNIVDLKWVTASESNNDYFTIERSMDGITFEIVDKTKGAGNNTSTLYYATKDYTPYPGTSYYRLRQTDFDGKFTYSKLRTVEFVTDDNHEFAVYPNPSDGQNINLSFVAKKGAELAVVISGANGNRHFANTINALSEGQNNYSIHFATKLVTGVYFITVTSGQTVYNKKLVVN